MSLSITCIILTFNEERHLERALRSLEGIVERICIIDSFSTDRTCEIARKHGVDVFENEWVNYANQFQWGLDNIPIDTEWIMRLDADEYLSETLRGEIIEDLPKVGKEVSSCYLDRMIVFQGRAIRHGFFYPLKMLRLWRTGLGYIEQRWMDEHIIVKTGESVQIRGDLVDENLNTTSWWLRKLDGYAVREMFDAFGLAVDGQAGNQGGHVHLAGPERRRRMLKHGVYYRLPGGFRAVLYFLYRYIFGRGFLDGVTGSYYHFVQALVYRSLVDLKIREVHDYARNHEVDVEEAIEVLYG